MMTFNKKFICLLFLFCSFCLLQLPMAAAAPLLARNSEGREVMLLQQMLQRQGYHLTVNSHFDAATETAVRQCQQKYGLPVTGKTNRTFWDLLVKRTDAPRSEQPPAHRPAPKAAAAKTIHFEHIKALQPRPLQEKKAPYSFEKRIELLRTERVAETKPFVPAARVAALISTAKKYIGVPYVYGGTTPKGFDCSGFIQYVFKKNNLELPRTADAQYLLGLREPVTALREGDLVFFATDGTGISHCGIYLGQGRFIHASSSHGIRIDELSNVYWRKYFIAGKHIIK